MRNQVFKKLFSALLALIMVAGLLPASVLAEGWTAADVDSTPAPAETVQPTESAEPTEPAETETPGVTEVPEPTPENPATMDEPTAEPAEGEEPAEPAEEETPAPEDSILLAAENVTARDTSKDDFYRIVHLDCGREYFSKDWIIALINEMAAAGYNQLQLAFGNGGFRFYLNDMTVDKYTDEVVRSALEYGNKQYNTYGEKDSEWKEYNPTTNALTESEMNAIITHAQSKGIEIVPMLNTPGHMNALLHAMSNLGIETYDKLIVSSGCMNLSVNAAADFTEKLVKKYITYFSKHKCKFFNLAMDEYYGSDGKTPSFTAEFFTYANKLIDKVISEGMTPRVFNDALTSSNNGNSGSFTAGTQVCCWNSANVNGYSLINTSHDFYYVSTNEAWNLNPSTVKGEGYTFVGDYDEDTWVEHAKEFNNNIFLYKKTQSNINSPVGSMFCIWCNTPGKQNETTIAQQIRMILRVIGARMQDKTEYAASTVLVEGGFKVDGTINVTADKVYSGTGTTEASENKKADEVIVSAAGLKTLTTTKVTENLPAIEDAAENKIVAYDVTPYTDNKTTKHTDKATVSIAIPEGWDTNKVRGFVVESGDSAKGNITTIEGKVEDGYYTFTALHFSVMGIYEQAVTYEDGGEITIPVGETGTLTIKGGATNIGEVSDSSIATKSGEPKPVSGAKEIVQITSTNDLDADAEYLIENSRRKQTLTSTNYTSHTNVRSGLQISGTKSVDNANVWTITYNNNGTAAIKNSSGQYLTIGYNSASVSDNTANLTLKPNVTSKDNKYTGWTISQSNYYLNNFGGGDTAAGWQHNDASNDPGSIWQIYEIAERPASTEITFEGKKVGETSIVIDGKIYKIKVVDKTLAEQKIDVELWITNGGVVPTGWDSNPPAGFVYQSCLALSNWTGKAYITVNAGQYGFNSEDGVVLYEAILGNVLTGTTTYGNSNNGTNVCNVEYWKTAYHTKDNRQGIAGWTNNSHLGIEFRYLRYWKNTWAYSTDRINWVEISDISATDSTKNQISIFYREPTTITDEVSTKVVDWGPTTYGTYQSLLDFAVKYESLDVRVPDAFPVSGKTIGFTRCEDTKNTQYKGTDSDGDAYRIVYGIAGVETADYEVYMITATNYRDSRTDSDLLNFDSVPSTYKYSGDEVVVWAKETTDATNSGLTVSDNLKTAADTNGEPYLESVNIYEYQALLITYYLRAKGGLKVHYIARNNGSEDEFYSYKIAVEKDTTFENIAQSGPTIETNTVTINDKEYAYIKNGKVKNIKGKYEYVTHVLTLIPEIKAQYRYTDFTCVEIKLSEDSKEAFLYYEFNNAKTYVVDFGIPLKIKLTDLNSELANATINSVKITGQTHGTAVYNESEKAIIYTLTKVLSERERLSVDVSGTRNNTPGNVTYNVTIIPATTVYYEDSFAKFYGADKAEQKKLDASSDKDKAGVWYIDGETATVDQALEALGQENHNPYGYDPAYNNCTMFSMGSARKVTVTNDMAKEGVVWPTAQFTFKGTGFDIISLTDNTSGAIFVDVVNAETGAKAKSVFVDNYYGYTYNETNGWQPSTNNEPNALYQIPVIAVRGLEYAEYNVVIKVAYNTFFDHTTSKGSYSFWLDAVRVYNPAGNELDTEYGKDSEAKPVYTEVRKALIGQGNFVSNDATNVTGAVFIDGKATGATIGDYTNYGPNHEVYLAQGQAIAFKIVADSEPKTVQLGVKLANGESGTLNIGGDGIKFAAYNDKEAANSLTLGTATDMYYALTGLTWNAGTGEQSDKKVSNLIVLTNSSAKDAANIISITNVKCTFEAAQEAETNTVALAISYDDALMAVSMVNNLLAPEPEPEPEKTFEPERFEASWTKNVMQGRKATLTVKTSEDVEAITVDGQTIRSYRTRTERVGFGRYAKRVTYREFTYSMVAQESADFSVTAINAEGTESEAITARLTVQKRPESIRDIWNWFKGWF